MIDAPTTADADAVGELREVFRRAGYDGAGIGRAFGGLSGSFSRDPLDLPVYLRRLERDSPIATLIKLFLLEVSVPRAEAERAFEPLAVDRVAAMGIVQAAEDGEVAPTVSVFPLEGDVLLTTDRQDARLRQDYVMGASISSRVLAAITVRAAVDSALDVGTGSGFQAFHASPHARRVVATDVNPRALAFAEFNAALNGILNVETRLGTTFEPVSGESFDLIVANPPYVISPDAAFVYRDSGLPGDSFSEGMVRRIPEFLGDGGYGHVLVEWAYAPGEDWHAPLRRWVEGSGCDALLLHHLSQDPLSYAATWNQDLRADPREFGRALDRWTEYDRNLGIERIGWGAVVLRRRSGDNWVRPLETTWSAIEHASEHVARIFRGHDYVRSLPLDRGLLGAVLALPPEHRIDQTFVAGGGVGSLVSSALRLEGGLGTVGTLEQKTLRVVTLLDGTRPLGDVIWDAAEAGGESPGALVAETLAGIVQLVETGLVVPAA